MGQDLRELFKDDSLELNPTELSKDHELRFLDKLDCAFSSAKEKDSNLLLTGYEKNKNPAKINVYKKGFSVAASLIISVGLGWYLFTETKTLQQPPRKIVHIKKQKNEIISLANVSPEFKRFEEMSLATINVGLAELRVNDTNRSMVKGYIKQLEYLKKEYQDIQSEFQVNKITPQAVEVLVENLQMQLALLEQLKQKVKNFNEYSSSKAYQNLKT